MFEIAAGIILAVLILTFWREIVKVGAAVILFVVAAAILWGVSEHLSGLCLPTQLPESATQPTPPQKPARPRPPAAKRIVSPYYFKYLNDQAAAIKAKGGHDAAVSQFLDLEEKKPFSGMPASPAGQSSNACVAAGVAWPWVLLIAVLVAWGVATRNALRDIVSTFRNAPRVAGRTPGRGNWLLASLGAGLLMSCPTVAFEDRYGVPNPPEPLAVRLVWVSPILMSVLVIAITVVALVILAIVQFVRRKSRKGLIEARAFGSDTLAAPPTRALLASNESIPRDSATGA